MRTVALAALFGGLAASLALANPWQPPVEQPMDSSVTFKKDRPRPGEYPGPLGLKWGMPAPEVRYLLDKRLKFVEEIPGKDENYLSLDQRYQGDFAKLKTTDILLRFYRGEFFYMTVSLATAEAGTASATFAQVVELMTKAYGKPRKASKPIQMTSPKAILDNVKLVNPGWVLPMFWSESRRVDEKNLNALRDLQIRTGLWDAFAGWRFKNGVTVQTFVYQYKDEEKAADPKALPELRVQWLFSKDAVFRVWRADAARAHDPALPRDF